MSEVKIPQIDGKDLLLAAYRGDEFTLVSKGGQPNCLRYKAVLDDSMDLPKLREAYYKTYRNRDFNFWDGGREYTTMVISLTFKYVVRLFNRAWGNTYVKLGHSLTVDDFTDNACVRDGELVGIIVEEPVSEPIDISFLGASFYFANGAYHVKGQPPVVVNSPEVRAKLYEDGFDCDGVHYVRWKRSPGSARVGKCLFIAEPLFKGIRKWERCGIKLREGDSVDLAAYESYISLTSSSTIGRVTIRPENILVVDDLYSTFDDDVVVVSDVDGRLTSEHKRTEISNCLFDGESLIDRTLMGEYASKGMILLRNRFFKSCCFNCNLQQWFVDHGITEVSQLNGKTLAKRIEDVLFVTTPSSIKYIKFGKLKNWLNCVEPEFGVVKYEKPPKYLNGTMVQSHYQLLNSIQMTAEDIEEFIKPTLDFLRLVRKEPAVLQEWIAFTPEDELVIEPLKSKSDIIYKLMSVNPDFCRTKLYLDFRAEFIRSFLNQVRSGKVLIEGNYSTLCGNPIELLQHAIGQFDGTSTMGQGEVYSTRFPFDTELVASRSPHITMSNVWLPINRWHREIERYMNPTNEILYVNAIGDNLMQRLAGCDYDSDGVLLSDNRILIAAAKRTKDKFPVAVYDVSNVKLPRTYSSRCLADLDYRTSENLIGEIVNMSQELNTRIWDMLHAGATMSDVMPIYLDVCKLSIMSNVEIDKAKREFLIDNGLELREIRAKYKVVEGDKVVKPYFFAHISRHKGYYNAERNHYKHHNSTMDILETQVNRFSRSTPKGKASDVIPFSDILDTERYNRDGVYRLNVKYVFDAIDRYNSTIQAVYADERYTKVERYELNTALRAELAEYIGKLKINPNTAIALLRKIESPEYSSYRMLLFYTLFSYPNESFYQCLQDSHRSIPHLIETPDGDIQIFISKYTKIV